MTTRQDLDALIDGMEHGYADASTPLEQTRAVAAAALSSAYLLADALDILMDRLVLPAEDDLNRQIIDLKTEVAELRRQVEQLSNSARKDHR